MQELKKAADKTAENARPMADKAATAAKEQAHKVLLFSLLHFPAKRLLLLGLLVGKWVHQRFVAYSPCL